MDLLHHLAIGSSTALTLQNLVSAFSGCVLGILIGLLPAPRPVAAMAMVLPLIHSLDATPVLMMLAGIYCGAQYGRATSGILLKGPGESNMGAALAAAGVGSFFAGCLAIFAVAILAAPLTELATSLGPAEYFSLAVLSLTVNVVLASGSLIKSMAMVVLGLLLGQINTDATSGVSRFSFDLPELSGGIGFVVIALGMFGLGEMIARLGQPGERREVLTKDPKGLWPSQRDLHESWRSMLRGSALGGSLGSVLGMLPGGGTLLASYAADALERKVGGRDPLISLGKGAIQCVSRRESAHSAGTRASFVPMLTLGIPANAAMAMMVGAMSIKGIQPGPQLMSSSPGLFWGLIASMAAANLMLVALNLPLMGIWSRLLTVPYRFLFPAIVVFCCIGSYALNYNSFDVYLTASFAVLGYLFHKLSCEPAPLLLGFILAPLMEDKLRRALLLSQGDWSTFISQPLSAGLLITALLLVIVVILPTLRTKREQAFRDD